MSNLIDQDKMSESQEKVLLGVLHKHGIFWMVNDMRDKHLRTCALELIRLQRAGGHYDELLKKRFSEVNKYAFPLKKFDKFITEYFQTMKSYGVILPDVKAIDAVINNFDAWLRSNDVLITPLPDDNFYEKIRKRFLIER